MRRRIKNSVRKQYESKAIAELNKMDREFNETRLSILEAEGGFNDSAEDMIEREWEFYSEQIELICGSYPYFRYWKGAWRIH